MISAQTKHQHSMSLSLSLQGGGGGVLLVDRLSDMVLRGQAVQVHLEPLDRLEMLMVEVQEWKDSAAETFLQKESTLTLLEVKEEEKKNYRRL